MSSAILYLAIIAIWACVLIPRWLKRGAAAQATAPVPAPVAAEPAPEAEDGSLEDEISGADHPARVPESVSPEEGRRRMLAARRRLLLMLIGLEIAAVSLAVLRLAAVWVVVPPTIMLGGYVLLLREAGQADAERAQRDAAAIAAAHARERAQASRAEASRAQASRATPVEGTSTESVTDAAAALAAKFAAAPVPADYEDAGRDFAPGLAGKYTTSNADSDPAEPAGSADEDYDDYYEAYDQPRLRAVGD